MFPISPQLTNFSNALVVHDIEGNNHVAPSELSPAASNQVPYGAHGFDVSLNMKSKRLEDELKQFGSIIKQHEDNLKFLKAQASRLDDSIVDLQVRLGKHHSSSATGTENDDLSLARTQKDVIDQIMKYDKSAAGLLCQLQARQAFQNSSLKWIKDVVGIVATLGCVDDDNISRLLSEYLGLDTMLAIVCKSYDGVKDLESYDSNGHVDKDSGIHGLGGSIGRALPGRFQVICLEKLRSYAGGFVFDDPQRRLEITKPRLPNGEIPAGFLGFAVNLIKVDRDHLYCLTANGCGIRETLFYSLFSRLQVYRSRSDMFLALPLISDGAISLDGGMIRRNGVYSLGSREEIDVRFPKASMDSDAPLEYSGIEKQIKQQEMEKERVTAATEREISQLDIAKHKFQKKKQEFVLHLAKISTYPTQQPTMQHPTMQQPTMQHPAMQHPTMQHPTMQQPTMQQPTMQQPTMQQPTMQHPGTPGTPYQYM